MIFLNLILLVHSLRGKALLGVLKKKNKCSRVIHNKSLSTLAWHLIDHLLDPLWLPHNRELLTTMSRKHISDIGKVCFIPDPHILAV